MNRNTVMFNLMPPCSPLTNIFLFTFFFLATRKALAVDSYYLACTVPRTCGVHKISFPFFIQGEQQESCGYPGFSITCLNNSTPILSLPDNDDLIIREIVYRSQSLRVSNAAVLTSEIITTPCIPQIRNVTIPRELFRLAEGQTELFLLHNCNLSSATDLLQYMINCTDRNETDSVLALFDDDPQLGYASEKCKNPVAAPVDAHEGEAVGGVAEMLERGFVMKWIASNCSICEASGGRCGFDYDTYHFKCFCPDRPHAWHCADNGNRELKLKLGMGIGLGVPALLLFMIMPIYFIRRYYKQKHGSSNFLRANTSSNPSSNSDLEGGRYFGVPIFSYCELEKATNNFDYERELGDGGFGTVYHGKLPDGREVAIKRLYEHNYRRVKQFMNEVEILTRLRHKNLVTLYGCTSHRSRELLLVYEYVPNGTVADHLHGDRAEPGSLAWPIRMSIAIETASALVYLHASDIIHRDVKTNNILLDSNFSVKVADFGLSRLFPNDVTHVSTAPQGTPGYVDPEYHQCYQLTEKSDVYSFGVVLIELVSSMPAVDISRHRHEINLANLAISKIQKCAFDELIDPNLGYKSDEDIRKMTIAVAELAFRCLQQEKEMRPSMEEVLEELKGIQRGDKKLEEVEEGHAENNDALNSIQPPPSPPPGDEIALLKNIQPPPSPVSVTDKWVSKNTTADSSG